jgi:hypothetical protein
MTSVAGDIKGKELPTAATRHKNNKWHHYAAASAAAYAKRLLQVIGADSLSNSQSQSLTG